MKKAIAMMMIAGAAAALAACGVQEPAAGDGFKYTVDAFADLKVMRYKIPGWEELTLRQKEYAYHLAEAAKFGRDILWDQNCKDNLRVRHAVEAILEYVQDGTLNAEEIHASAERVRALKKKMQKVNGK